MSQLISSSDSIISTSKPLDNIIYKVKKIKNNMVDTIYVFYGRKDIKLQEEIIKQIFTSFNIYNLTFINDSTFF